MNLLIFGLLNHQHIQNFARALKDELGFTLWGINNNPTIRPNFECITAEIFEGYLNVKRSDNFLDVIIKFISSIKCFLTLCREKNIDIVQFHYISYFVLPIIVLAKLVGIRTSVFVYGSDILRSNSLFRYYCKLIFKLADSVVCDSTTLCALLKDKYHDNADKIECVLFGSVIIDKLDELSKNRLYYKSVLGLPTDRLCVMCGYNAVTEQNHLSILKSLDGLQGVLYLVLPMTYGGTEEYVHTVREEVRRQGWDYLILDNFINDEQWCMYTAATDIFIHMQMSDAFSSSLAEHLFMGNVVINAEWLKYDDLSQHGILYFEANFSTLNKRIVEVIHKISELQKESMVNKAPIRHMKSLKYTVINNWGPYFRRVAGFKI